MANARSSCALVFLVVRNVFGIVYRREPASCLQQADVLLIKRLIRLGRHWKAISIFYVIGSRPLLAFLRLSDVTPHKGISCHYFWKKKKEFTKNKVQKQRSFVAEKYAVWRKGVNDRARLGPIFIRSPVTPLTIYFFFLCIVMNGTYVHAINVMHLRNQRPIWKVIDG